MDVDVNSVNNGVRRNINPRQMEILLDFALENRSLALGILRNKAGRATAKTLWAGCASRLNAEGPPIKLPKEWMKIWNDMKCRARGKISAITEAQKAAKGDSLPAGTPMLNETENRIIKIIGKNIGCIPCEAQDFLLRASAEAAQENQFIKHESIDQMNDKANTIVLSPQTTQQPLYTPPLPILQISALPQLPDPAELQLPPPAKSQLPPPPIISASTKPALRGMTSRRRRRPMKPRQSSQRTHTQSPQTAHQSLLEDTCSNVMQLESMRAQTDAMMAEAALRNAEAAKLQAEADLVAAESNALVKAMMSKAALRNAEATLSNAEATLSNAEAALRSAGVAKMQAEAALTSAQSMAAIMPAIRLFIETHSVSSR